MLLNIYLVTTAINWVVSITFSVACSKNLERKGYKFVKQEKSILEKVMDFISTAFKLSIPVLNILNTILILLKGDKMYEEMEEELLEKGKIYMPTDEVEIKMETKEDKISSMKESKTYTEKEKKVSLEKRSEEIPRDIIKEIDEKIAYLKGKIYMPTDEVEIKMETKEDKISSMKESKTYTEKEKKVSLEKKSEEIPRDIIKEIDEKKAYLNREKEILIGFEQEKQVAVLKKQK